MRELNCMGRNNNRRNRRRYGSIETIDSYEIDDNQQQQQQKKKSLLKRTGTFIVKSCRLMTYGVPHMPYNLPYNDCNGPYHYDFYRSQDYPYNYNDYGRYDNNQYMRYGEYGPGGLYF
ncbi:hypothetical protein DERP_006241 [Dermatophagoides pteronyssinus]|uniref:Uncharacterized protein n=1 Tax=Dermatophagoides pteronyssinus TaxID=6956 RepID=A0ABQ8IY79_DERPT|nr:hypothetical protein DERP_006241 [Dermatophagoides pteronyssinus]